MGINRHIFGLTTVLRETADKSKFRLLQRLLENPVIVKMSTNAVSTSTINYLPIKYGYFFPVEEAGIGIFYITADNAFRAMITG